VLELTSPRIFAVNQNPVFRTDAFYPCEKHGSRAGARKSTGGIDPTLCAGYYADGVPSAWIVDRTRMKNHPGAIGDLV
jgi:hypothetical protein